jgi:hypothetical protein
MTTRRRERARASVDAPGHRWSAWLGAAAALWAPRVLAGPPQPQLPDWRDPCYNCYNHACNSRGKAYRAQPGGGVEAFPFNSADIIEKAERDGLTYIDSWRPGDPPPECHPGCLVAAAIKPWDAPWGDFHWYRLNDNGQWSEKMGTADANIFRNDGVDVTDPATADRGLYIEFVGYFCAPYDPPATLIAGDECEPDRAEGPRAQALRNAGSEDPAYVPSDEDLILRHLPTEPAIPDPQWPPPSLLPEHFAGYGYFPGQGSTLPFAFARVFMGSVALYTGTDGQNVTYYADNNGLGAFLAGYFPDLFPWFEHFDTYADGPPPTTSGWVPWDNSPVAAGFVVTADAARSPPHSLAVDNGDDAVHPYSGHTAGAWSFSTYQFIPASFASNQQGALAGTWFILLDQYQHGGPYHWAVLLRFDSNDGKLHAYHGQGSSTIDIPYVADRWVRIQTIIDLDFNWLRIYYDGALLAAYPWTIGADGTGGGTLNIGAVDLWANGSSAVYYDEPSLHRITGCGDTLASDFDLDGRSLLEEYLLATQPCDADTDLDGAIDGSDNCPRVWNPLQSDGDGNGIGDACEMVGTCEGDCASPLDGEVDVSDLLALLAQWSTSGGAGGGGPCDQNDDGFVNVTDLLALLAAWGQCPRG